MEVTPPFDIVIYKLDLLSGYFLTFRLEWRSSNPEPDGSQLLCNLYRLIFQSYLKKVANVEQTWDGDLGDPSKQVIHLARLVGVGDEADAIARARALLSVRSDGPAFNHFVVAEALSVLAAHSEQLCEEEGLTEYLDNVAELMANFDALKLDRSYANQLRYAAASLVSVEKAVDQDWYQENFVNVYRWRIREDLSMRMEAEVSMSALKELIFSFAFASIDKIVEGFTQVFIGELKWAQEFAEAILELALPIVEAHLKPNESNEEDSADGALSFSVYRGLRQLMEKAERVDETLHKRVFAAFRPALPLWVSVVRKKAQLQVRHL